MIPGGPPPRRSLRAAWPERVRAAAVLARVIARDPAADPATVRTAGLGLVAALMADDAPAPVPAALLGALGDTAADYLDRHAGRVNGSG